MTFTEAEIKQISDYLLEIPAKYANPLLTFIAAKQKESLEKEKLVDLEKKD